MTDLQQEVMMEFSLNEMQKDIQSIAREYAENYGRTFLDIEGQGETVYNGGNQAWISFLPTAPPFARFSFIERI